MKSQIEHYENKLRFEMDPSDLFAALEEKRNIIVIDARKEHAYVAEHIPNAINIPHRIMNPESTSHLDRKNIYVVYCDGIGCNASTKGALNMAKLGFEVRELIGGIEWWKLDGYATDGVNAKSDGKLACSC